MRDIIKEHQAEGEAWRKTCEERFDEALAQGCVPTLNNYSWVSWEKLPKSADPYDIWNMSPEFARIMIKRQIEQLQARVDELEGRGKCPDCGIQVKLLGTVEIPACYCPDENCAWSSWLTQPWQYYDRPAEDES